MQKPGGRLGTGAPSAAHDDQDVRAEYMKRFKAEARRFSHAMAEAVMKWRSLNEAEKGDEERAWISAMVHIAITLHILSMKLFLSGHTVAAGNLFRQACESIALALVCSRKDLGILEQFMKDSYSTNKAIRDALKHSRKLGLNKDGIEALERARNFYDEYSHPTRRTIATAVSFSEIGLYVGVAFDEGKVEAYKREAGGRVSLANTFPNFVDGVVANISKW